MGGGLGLPAGIAASAYGLVAVLLAYWVLREHYQNSPTFRAAAYCATFSVISVPLIPYPALLLAIATPFALFLYPTDKRHAPAIFFCLLFLFPDDITYQVPFPGLNYLFEYQWWLIVVILFMLRFRPTLSHLRPNATDIFFILFVVSVIAMDFRGVSITEGARRATMTSLYYLVPYFIFRRAFGSFDDFRQLLHGFVIVAVFLAALALVSQAVKWDFMKFQSFRVEPEYRFGLVRLGTTLSTVLLGTVVAIGLLAAWVQRNPLITRISPRQLLTVLMFFLAILSTGSRAAIVFALISITICIFHRRLTSFRFRAITVALISTYSVLLQRVVSFDTTSLDTSDYDTFGYRQRLIQASLKKIGETPWLGDHQFLDSWHFNDLVQGQGIVDIVNRYLQIGLEYGVVVLAFFIFAFYFCLSNIFRVLDRANNSQKGNAFEPPVLGFIAACIVGYIVVIGTTSDTSHIGILGACLLGIARCAANITERDIGLGRNQSRLGNFGQVQRINQDAS